MKQKSKHGGKFLFAGRVLLCFILVAVLEAGAGTAAFAAGTEPAPAAVISPAAITVPSTYNSAGIQAAINSAASGDTVDLSGAPGGAITLSSALTITGKNITFDGGTNGVTVTDGTTRHILVKGNCVLGLNNIILDGNGTGGGIGISGTTSPTTEAVTVTSTGGGVIQNCSAVYGGGINCDDSFGGAKAGSPTLTLDGITVTGCKATTGNAAGGGVYISYSPKVTLNNTVIDNNTCDATGGAMQGGGGGLYIANSNSTATMNGGSISGNTCIAGSRPGYGGGGISLTGNGSSFTLNSGAVDNNISRATSGNGQGGGIYVYPGTNKAWTSTLNINGGSVNNNKAGGPNATDGTGGGVLVVANVTINISGGSIDNNSAGSTGGGIQLLSGRTDDKNPGYPANLNMTGGSINNNSAGLYGGGIESSLGFINMTGGTVNNNKALTQWGGGIDMQNGSELTLGGSAVISGNTATYGGGVAANDSAPNTSTKSTYSKITMSGGTISDNDATTEGGGIYINTSNAADERNILNMSGGLITGNSAGTTGGGGIANMASTVNITGGEISDNTSAAIGGGILNTSTANLGGILNLSGDTVINGNSAITAGGGIYNGISPLPSTILPVINISGDATIDGNTATTGGGIYNAAKIAMTGGAISDNEADGNGGGIFVGGAGTVTMSGGTVNENTAASWGGGIYTSGSGTGYVTISGSSLIADNKAILGGGIYNGYPVTSTSSMVTVNSGEISGNTATGPDTVKGSGGGIFTVRFDKLKVAAGVVFAENSAPGMRISDLTTQDLDSSGVADLTEYGTYVGSVTISSAVAVQAAALNLGPNAPAYNNYDINYLPDPTYKVIYHNDGADTATSTVPVDDNDYYASQDATALNTDESGGDLAKAGYIFGGWTTTQGGTSVDYAPKDVIPIIDSDVHLYPVWIPLYTVTFDSQGGSSVDPITDILSGDLAAEPEDPTKAGGDVFGGWYLDADCTEPYDFSTPVTSDITLYAKWTPIANNDSNSGLSGTPIEGSVLDNDKGTAITVTDHTPPQYGTLVINEDGTYTYTSDKGYSGKDSFTYTITNENGQTSTATVDITIDPLYTVTFDSQGGSSVDPITDILSGDLATEPEDPTKAGGDVFGGWYLDADCTEPYDFSTPVTYDITLYAKWTPVANDDSNTGQTGTPIKGSVLDNDKGTGITVTNHTQPKHGTLVINEDGTYTYTPDEGYSGKDSFTYTITNENGQTSTATVDITINPATITPVKPAAVDNHGSTKSGHPLKGNVLDNDTGTGITVTNHTQPKHGTLVINKDGAYTYTPNKGYTGKDSFTYTITDENGQTSTAVVTIDVTQKKSTRDTGDNTKSNVTQNQSTPVTGDNTNVDLYMGFASAAALLAAGALLFMIRRRSNGNNAQE